MPPPPLLLPVGCAPLGAARLSAWNGTTFTGEWGGQGQEFYQVSFASASSTVDRCGRPGVQLATAIAGTLEAASNSATYVAHCSFAMANAETWCGAGNKASCGASEGCGWCEDTQDLPACYSLAEIGCLNHSRYTCDSAV